MGWLFSYSAAYKPNILIATDNYCKCLKWLLHAMHLRRLFSNDVSTKLYNILKWTSAWQYIFKIGCWEDKVFITYVWGSYVYSKISSIYFRFKTSPFPGLSVLYFTSSGLAFSRADAFHNHGIPQSNKFIPIPMNRENDSISTDRQAHHSMLGLFEIYQSNRRCVSIVRFEQTDNDFQTEGNNAYIDCKTETAFHGACHHGRGHCWNLLAISILT